MADVVLVHPKVLNIKSRLVPLPLNLLSISSLLDEEGYKIKIIDQRIKSGWKELKKKLMKELKSEPICVGITSMTGLQILNGLEISKIVKENSNVPVVWGGTFPTIMPEITIENENIDIVCEGEGEITFYEVVKRLEGKKSLSEVRGIWYKEKKKINRNKKRSFLDLNNIPNIPYHIINLNDYKNCRSSTLNLKEFTINLITSRGCPYICTYCYNSIINQGKWRALKSKRVVELLRYLVDKYNIKNFRFDDDNFFVDQKRVNEIMRGILREKMDIVMTFQGMRVDTFCKMKKNELDLLYKAGCRGLAIGMETGSPRILKLLKKGTTIQQTYATNKRLIEYPEIKSYYNFMTGIPTETVDDFFMTVNMISKLFKENPNMIIPTIFLFVPIPGTELYNLAIRNGFVPPNSLTEWGSIDWSQTGDKSFNAQVWLSEKFKKKFKKVALVFLLADLAKILPDTIPLVNLYSPIAKFRIKNGFYDFMPEKLLFSFMWRVFENKRY